MIQCFNFKTRELKIYDSIETACIDLDTPYTTVINHIYRKSLLQKTILIVRGELSDKDLISFKGIKYIIENSENNNRVECFSLEEVKAYFLQAENKQVGPDSICRIIRLQYKMFKKYYIKKQIPLENENN